MNKTVQLVNAWAGFEDHHPNGELEDFCRHYLALQRQKKITGPIAGGVIPKVNNGFLLKIIGRIHKINMGYAGSALEGTGLNQVEELGILMTIRQEENPRKTDIIYTSLFELSSGTDMLNRLRKRGLISEHDDLEDKRSKRIRITDSGEQAIIAGTERMVKVARMIMNDLTDDDKDLCIQLLKNVEIKFSRFWQSHKGKAFDEIYELMMKDTEEKP